MARTLSGSTSMPFWLTMKPNNFPDLTPNVHLLGFNRSLYFLNLSNIFVKYSTCCSSSADFTIMSSTYTSTSL
ncbi:hypothetical protein MtrunA17_Chr0c03g0490051 [Medicago truncatula]|uniref:Uncharacterized protein n=1 Tax=Medicago truncatula TaxID=3880 RepID=A0A396G9H3_MEDTR|nr:hypothetical protein MtrunA17_Chr0c03g0490051 [Medicago truncatula]